MSTLTKEEIAGWIRNLMPYLEKPVILAPEGYFDKKEYEVGAGKIIEYGDNLMPNGMFKVIEQTENLRVLVELYKSVEEINK